MPRLPKSLRQCSHSSPPVDGELLTLIIPVYRNEASLPDLLVAIDGLAKRAEGGMETVFVIDGSPDGCYEILRRELPLREFCSKLILLSRNFGSFAAIRAGLAQ